MLVRSPRSWSMYRSMCPIVATLRVTPRILHQFRFKSNVVSTSGLYSAFENYKKTFPHEQLTISYMASYKRITQYPPKSPNNYVNIGVAYSDPEPKSKFVDVLLADPLSANNKLWFEAIEARGKDRNNTFEYTERDLFDPLTSRGGNYKIPSPVLSSEYRLAFRSALGKELQPINIRLREIHDLTDAQDVDFFINVTSDISIPPRPEIKDKVLLNIIDNTDYTPESRELTPYDPQHSTVKINSQLIYAGISDFLKYDVDASTEYFASITKSNILEAAKAISWYLSADHITDWILAKIKQRVSNYKSAQDLSDIIEDIKSNEVANFSLAAHEELQNSFMPETTKFFKNKLAWWKLYFKNDNVEYDINEYFSQNFLNKSTANYSYTQGQLDYKLSSSHTNVPNPIIELKEDVINRRVPTEIQPFVNKILVESFAYYQAPVAVIAALGNLHFGVDLNTTAAIGLLGLTVGFNHVSKYWEAKKREWLATLFEDTRVCLSKACVEDGLLKELNLKYAIELDMLKKRKEVLEKLT